MECMQLQIHGRVQGVYYRASTQKKAIQIGLVGWVRNCNDGTVSLLAEGEREKLEDLLKWCRQGPPLARVHNISVQWEVSKGEHVEFRILR